MKRAGCMILAGIMAAGMCVGLAGCKDEPEALYPFYPFQVAYWKNFLSYENIEELKRRVDAEEYQVLSTETKESIKTELIENYEDFCGIGPALYWNPSADNLQEMNKLKEMEIKDDGSRSFQKYIECQRYYGEFNGNHLLYIQYGFVMLAVVVTDRIQIKEVEFVEIDCHWYYLWTNPNHIEITFEENGGASL